MQHKVFLKVYGRLILCIPLILLIMVQISCKKWLDKKRYQNVAVPSSLKDLQALLDNDNTNGGSPGYLEFVADNFYLTSSSWNNAPNINDRLSYIWARDAQVSGSVWNFPYQSIYNANFVLDYIPKIAINESERGSYNNIKGTALFYRAFLFHQLAQVFCKPYSPSAGTDLGIVLRMTAAVEAPSTRSTVQQTYDQVIADLKTAAALLPATSIITTRPNTAAAYGALARVYLSMRDYVNAGRYADSCLSQNSSLLDYNSLTPVNSPVLPAFTNNPEILFLSYEGSYPQDLMGSSHQALIDSLLYQSYNANDLRRTVFFGSNTTGTYYWQGSYYQLAPTYIFDGIATDEIYLIRAECRARAGNKDAAMDDLNTLLRKRWKGQFTDLTATDATDALNQILIERRKELLFRGLRWSDLRRFNLEGASITLTRIINGTSYTLPPNDLRWVLLIPDLEISRSGIPQNPR